MLSRKPEPPIPRVQPSAPTDQQSVFLNIPFDREYSPLFVAIIAALTGLGRKPRCVLEIPASGRDRLGRIFELLSGCGSSIHDLSRVALSGPLQVPRFNMPFELGRGRTPELKVLKALTNRLSRILLRLQREQRRDDPFSPHLFRRSVEAATELALLEGLIAEG